MALLFFYHLNRGINFLKQSWSFRSLSRLPELHLPIVPFPYLPSLACFTIGVTIFHPYIVYKQRPIS